MLLSHHMSSLYVTSVKGSVTGLPVLTNTTDIHAECPRLVRLRSTGRTGVLASVELLDS